MRLRIVALLAALLVVCPSTGWAQENDLDPEAARLYNRGVELYSAGDLVGARAAFDSSLAMSPGYADAHYGLGLVLKKKGEAPDALSAFQKAVELAPANSLAWYNIGLIHADSKTAQGYQSAAEAYEKAVKANPAYANAYFALGFCYSKSELDSDTLPRSAGLTSNITPLA